MNDAEIEAIVLRAIHNINLAREPHAQIEESPRAAIFGPDSPLDSLGLVSLLIDVEEAMNDRGFDIMLSDARAMSQTLSPFRSVPALVAHIQSVLSAT